MKITLQLRAFVATLLLGSTVASSGEERCKADPGLHSVCDDCQTHLLCGIMETSTCRKGTVCEEVDNYAGCLAVANFGSKTSAEAKRCDCTGVDGMTCDPYVAERMMYCHEDEMITSASCGGGLVCLQANQTCGPPAKTAPSCPAPLEGQMAAVGADCGSFAVCAGETELRRFPCPVGYYFDELDQVCARPVSCTGSCEHGLCANPVSCSLYDVCMEGELVHSGACEHDKPNFDYGAQKCVASAAMCHPRTACDFKQKPSEPTTLTTAVPTTMASEPSTTEAYVMVSPRCNYQTVGKKWIDPTSVGRYYVCLLIDGKHEMTLKECDRRLHIDTFDPRVDRCVCLGLICNYS